MASGIRKDLYDQIIDMAKQAEVEPSQMVDTLLEYALKRVSVRRNIEVVFADEEVVSVDPPTHPVTNSIRDNGAQESDLPTYYPMSTLPHAERVTRLMSFMSAGPLTSLQLRTAYRERFKEDPGNINMVLDTAVRHGKIVVDRKTSPYTFSLPTN